MGPFYMLVDGKVKEASDFFEYSAWFSNDANRRIAETDVGDCVVSTVFLGIDHGWGRKALPVLFETMIFDKAGEDKGQWRYCTLEEAQAGHEVVVQNLRAGLEADMPFVPDDPNWLKEFFDQYTGEDECPKKPKS